jgi:hypothetical protein
MLRYTRYLISMAVGALLVAALIFVGQAQAEARSRPATIVGGTVLPSELPAPGAAPEGNVALEADPAAGDRVDATPRTFTYQGVLLNAVNAPVANGAYSMRFTLYRDNTTAVWQETQSVSVVDGFFSARLGTVTALPIDTFVGSTLFIGVAVASDPEMTPRQPLTQVPYAFVAEVAQRLQLLRSFGVVNADGSKRSGVNFSSSRSGTGIYLININETYTNDRFVSSIQPLSNNVNTACQTSVAPLVNGSSGQLLVELFGPAGNRVDCSFQFSVLALP